MNHASNLTNLRDMTTYLTKIAVDKARRAIMLGVGAKLFGSKPNEQVKNVGKWYGKQFNDNFLNMGLYQGGFGPIDGIRLYGKLNKHTVNIASWKNYRMMVKAGVPKEEAMMKAYKEKKAYLNDPKIHLDKVERTADVLANMEKGKDWSAAKEILNDQIQSRGFDANPLQIIEDKAKDIKGKWNTIKNIAMPKATANTGKATQTNKNIKIDTPPPQPQSTVSTPEVKPVTPKKNIKIEDQSNTGQQKEMSRRDFFRNLVPKVKGVDK